MIFVINYDRDTGTLIELQTFDDQDRSRAEAARLDLELTLNSHGIEREVVLLEAANEDALRLTHSRYFEDLATIVKLAAGRHANVSR